MHCGQLGLRHLGLISKHSGGSVKAAAGIDALIYIDDAIHNVCG